MSVALGLQGFLGVFTLRKSSDGAGGRLVMLHTIRRFGEIKALGSDGMHVTFGGGDVA